MKCLSSTAAGAVVAARVAVCSDRGVGVVASAAVVVGVVAFGLSVRSTPTPRSQLIVGHRGHHRRSNRTGPVDLCAIGRDESPAKTPSP